MSRGVLITKEETLLLKGIAILMVVIEHFGQIVGLGFLNPLGPIGVFLFLFLSGYGLTRSYQKSGRDRYFIKKLQKVYVPYIFTVCVFTLWVLIIGKKTDLPLFIMELLLIKLPQGSYWYLVLMFYWYICFYFLTFIISNKRYLVTMMMFFSILIILIMNFNRLYIWQFFSFPLGVIAAFNVENYDKEVSSLQSNNIVSTLFVVALISIIVKKLPYVDSHQLGFVDTIVQISLTLSLGILIILFRDILSRGVLYKINIFFGGLSYELYLGHAVSLDWVKEATSINKILIWVLLTIGITWLLKFLTTYFNKALYKHIVN
ncbi:acyltransferase [Lactobacillus agilis]|uniref:acyltransferase family protein n=1 Tax=Ligilactobacillus agilis TaxID=1601 RepID=UPI0014305366|nr:acyltransferase family protein [Ligilactobacillus agilis]NJE31526.1 acyltransferase [Ligilactobacillus agilis]